MKGVVSSGMAENEDLVVSTSGGKGPVCFHAFGSSGIANVV